MLILLSRITEKEMVTGLLPIVIDSTRAPHLEYFMQFLQTVTKPRITFDEWTSFLAFQSVPVDLSVYDEDGACIYLNLVTLRSITMNHLFPFYLNVTQ